MSNSRPSGGESAVVEQPALGEVADQCDRHRGKCARSADRGDEPVGSTVPSSMVGQSERHPLGLGEPGPVEVAEQQRVEGLLGLADELGSEGSGHGRLHR